MKHLSSWLYSTQQQIWQRSSLLPHVLRHQRPRNYHLSNPPARVLIVLTGLIGDTVMSTPVFTEARRLWSQSRITVLGQSHNCSLLAACPFVNECIETDALPFSLRKHAKVATLTEQLKQKKFDVAIIALGDQFAQVLADAEIPVRVGVKGHILEPFLTHSYEIGSARTWGPHERLNALRVLGLQVNDLLPELWVSQSARDSAGSRLAACGLPDATDYCVIHPFGRTAAQRLPIENLSGLAEGVYRAYGLKSVIVGGAEMRGRIPQSNHHALIDAVGALSLQELLGVIEHACIVISTDSGPFHIAGALKRPLIGLFRSRRPEHSTRYPQARVLFGQDTRCESACDWEHCQHVPCREMCNLTPDRILEFAVQNAL